MNTAPAVRLAAALLLAAAAAPLAALPEDADQPIRILSKEMVYDEKAARAVYKGGVTVNQGSLQITADTVTVELEDQRVTRVTADGNPAYYSQQLNEGASRVKADATTIVYHTRDERVHLQGRANLTQKGNEFHGELIEYDVRAGRVDASGGEAETPIRMVLQPKN